MTHEDSRSFPTPRLFILKSFKPNIVPLLKEHSWIHLPQLLLQWTFFLLLPEERKNIQLSALSQRLLFIILLDRNVNMTNRASRCARTSLSDQMLNDLTVLAVKEKLSVSVSWGFILCSAASFQCHSGDPPHEAAAAGHQYRGIRSKPQPGSPVAAG